MSLVQPPEGVSAEQIEQAEAMVAAAIGATTLAQRPLAQSGVVRGGVLSLRDGPLTALTTFSLNGYATTVPEIHPWHLWVVASPGAYGLASYAPTGGVYALTYTAGWTAETLPEALKQAILQTAQAVANQASQGGLTEYRVGDVTEKYAQPSSEDGSGLSDSTALLLAPWRRLRF